MANRHLARSIVVQSLFEADFNHKSADEAVEIFRRNAQEFAPGMGDFSFMENLMRQVLAKRGDLDNIIVKAAPDWPLEKISVVDRNILRLGLYELIFADRRRMSEGEFDCFLVGHEIGVRNDNALGVSR